MLQRLPRLSAILFLFFGLIGLTGLAACGSSEPPPSTAGAPAATPEPAGFGELAEPPRDERSDAERLADIRARLLTVRREVEAAREDYGGSEPETSRLLAIQGHISQLLRGLPAAPADGPSATPEASDGQAQAADAAEPGRRDGDGPAKPADDGAHVPAGGQDAEPAPRDLDDGGAAAVSETASAPPGGLPSRRASPRPLALHLASYRTVEQVREGWRLLREAHGPVLGDLQARVARKEVPGQGDYFRLYAGPIADRPGADDTCTRLQNRGGYCRVVPFDGVPLDLAGQPAGPATGGS